MENESEKTFSCSSNNDANTDIPSCFHAFQEGIASVIAILTTPLDKLSNRLK